LPTTMSVPMPLPIVRKRWEYQTSKSTPGIDRITI
jgi:hypothetical protein